MENEKKFLFDQLPNDLIYQIGCHLQLTKLVSLGQLIPRFRDDVFWMWWVQYNIPLIHDLDIINSSTNSYSSNTNDCTIHKWFNYAIIHSTPSGNIISLYNVNDGNNEVDGDDIDDDIKPEPIYVSYHRNYQSLSLIPFSRMYDDVNIGMYCDTKDQIMFFRGGKINIMSQVINPYRTSISSVLGDDVEYPYVKMVGGNSHCCCVGITKNQNIDILADNARKPVQRPMIDDQDRIVDVKYDRFYGTTTTYFNTSNGNIYYQNTDIETLSGKIDTIEPIRSVYTTLISMFSGDFYRLMMISFSGKMYICEPPNRYFMIYEMNPLNKLGEIEECNVYVLQFPMLKHFGYELHQLPLSNIWKVGLSDKGLDVFLTLDGHLYHLSGPKEQDDSLFTGFDSFSELIYTKNPHLFGILNLNPIQIRDRSKDMVHAVGNRSSFVLLFETPHEISAPLYEKLSLIPRPRLNEMTAEVLRRTDHSKIPYRLPSPNDIEKLKSLKMLGLATMLLMCSDVIVNDVLAEYKEIITKEIAEEKWSTFSVARRTNLMRMTLKELQPLGKQLGIKSYYSLKKQILIEYILQKEKKEFIIRLM